MRRIEFDWVQFDKLCSLPPVISQEDIAFVLGCSVDTLDRRVKEKHPEMTLAEYRIKRASHFRIGIINKQYQVAMGGNCTMLIWLGKQYLNQTDKNGIDANVTKDGEKLVINFTKTDEKETK